MAAVKWFDEAGAAHSPAAVPGAVIAAIIIDGDFRDEGVSGTGVLNVCSPVSSFVMWGDIWSRLLSPWCFCKADTQAWFPIKDGFTPTLLLTCPLKKTECNGCPCVLTPKKNRVIDLPKKRARAIWQILLYFQWSIDIAIILLLWIIFDKITIEWKSDIVTPLISIIDICANKYLRNIHIP